MTASGHFSTLPAPPSPPAPAPIPFGDSPGSAPFQRFGFAVLLLFLFLIYSRVFDVKFAFLHIPGISLRVILLMVLLSRAFVTALKNRIGLALLGFTMWFIVTIPFSIWRRGSLDFFRENWFAAFVMYLAVGGLIGNFRQCRRAANTVAMGLFVFTIIALLFGTMETGRLFLPQGKFANPNEMAQALLLGVPLWWFILIATRSPVTKVFAFGVLLLMLYTVTKTGSRGAFVALAFLVGMAFLRTTFTGKVKLVAVVCTMVVVGALIVPSRLLKRYTTFAEDTEAVANPNDAMTVNALASTGDRKALLIRSIKFTIYHPIFGVGPGMFPVADNDIARSDGRLKGTWMGTHNSYTQVSSEMGIPGLLFYVSALVFSLRDTHRLFKATRHDPRLHQVSSLALGLNFTLIAYGVTVFFAHIAYTSMLSVLAGLAASLVRTADIEIQRLTAGTPPPQPAPLFQPSRFQQTAGF
jgi:O-antigen ligase